MDLVLWEWVNLCVRWLHVITAIAWIGSSFYFVHLDLSLRHRPHLPPEAGGEAWQIHGGGFYNMVKYLTAPATLPEELTWFKWEAYTTWISGFLLLCALYYRSPDLYLIDPGILALTPWQAVLASLLTLSMGWIGYDLMCRSALGRSDLRLALAGFVYLLVLAFLFAHVFSGRGALLQTGALIGTMMVANVFIVIIPNQTKVVKALLKGEKPDPALGKAAKQRSLHNNYLTLPVLFLMLSNHYPLVIGARYAWAMVGVVLIMGAAIRHFFNSRHAHKPSPWWTWIVAALGLLALVLLGLAGPADAEDAAALRGAAGDIVISRCSMCHTAEPGWPGLAAAPRGIRLDDEAMIDRNAELIRLWAVQSHVMPPGNVTEMTPEERLVLDHWTAMAAP
ncbi:Uncharacterized membrane protein [Arboricoccus pini]|uniref:Uncharacterized membrane protein n=1 Tax=Arboricoccus pini TaxID=1963835 RepID=A0A212PW27_9PROT|nr:urate hydroxylase PuuD [Arboricoccus pini]SNB51165.1 Uncharacterized membrane protein [Arboricoccus pini]